MSFSGATFKFLGFAGACASLAIDAIAQTRPGEAGLRGEVNGEAFAGGRLKNEMALSVLWKPAFEEIVRNPLSKIRGERTSFPGPQPPRSNVRSWSLESLEH